MIIEAPEGGEEKTIPGQVFESTKILNGELETQDSREIRIYGKKLIEKDSENFPEKKYYEVQDAPDNPEAYFDASIYGVEFPHTYRTYFNLNSGGYNFTIKPENIKDFRIKVLPKES